MRIAPPAPRAAWWQSGYAADCKSAYAGSIPAHASKCAGLAWPGLLCQNTAPRDGITAPARFLIRSSSAVEQAAVNRRVGGSNPSSGATSGPLSFGGRPLSHAEFLHAERPAAPLNG